MSVIIEIAYGHRIRSRDDWYLRVARDASLALFETGTPGSTLIDAFPAREWSVSNLISSPSLTVSQWNISLRGFLAPIMPASRATTGTGSESYSKGQYKISRNRW